MSKLVNQSINHGKFPECLNQSVIRPKHKRKSIAQFENYHPKAFLSSLDKIIEVYVLKYFNKYFTENEILRKWIEIYKISQY